MDQEDWEHYPRSGKTDRLEDDAPPFRDAGARASVAAKAVGPGFAGHIGLTLMMVQRPAGGWRSRRVLDRSRQVGRPARPPAFFAHGAWATASQSWE